MPKYLSMFRYRTIAIILVMTLAIYEAFVPIAYAADHELRITRANGQTSAQTTVGAAAETYHIKAYVDRPAPGGGDDIADGVVTFPPGLIQASAAAPGSGWAGAPVINQGAGTIRFQLSRSATRTGFTTLFTVSLKPIGAGTAAIDFGGSSFVNNASTPIRIGSVITIINPAPTTPSQPAPKPPTPAKPSTPTPIVSVTPTPTPSIEPELPSTPDPTGLIDTVQIQSRYNTATITWKVNAANPKSTIKYGSQASTLDKEGVATVADGTFTSTIRGLEPGVRYYFSINGSGDAVADGSYTGTILTSGFPVTITVTENNIAVKGAQIKVGTRTYTTAASGKITFGLAEGTHKATISTETASQTVSLVVAKKTIPANDGTPETQSFTYNLTSSPLESGPGSGTTILAFLGALVGGTVIIAFGFLGFMAYRRRKYDTGGSATPLSTVVIDDGYNWHQNQTEQSNEPLTVAPTPNPAQSAPHYNNSVYIDEEEPLDMFEKDKQSKP